MNNETWKPLIHPDIKDGYMLSSYGKIKNSLDDSIPSYEPSYHSSNGYDYEKFILKDGSCRMFPIDDLIALTFIPIPEELKDKKVKVNHIDEDNRRNNIDNLEWTEDIEEWRVVEYPRVLPTRYEVSNFGNVRDIETGKRPSISISHGLHQVNLKFEGGKNGTVNTRRLIAVAFVPGKQEEYDYLKHIDDCKQNIDIKNLEWYTPGEDKRVFPDEIWKPLVFEDVKMDMYEVSSYGRIRNKKTHQMISSCNSHGYRTAKLMHNDNKSYNDSIHRIVCFMFVSNDHNLPEVNHKDGDKTNNHYTNLEWCTQKENVEHAIRTGLTDPSKRKVLRGDNHPSTLVSDDNIDLICRLLIEYYGNTEWVYFRMKEIGIDVSLRTIQHVKQKDSRRDISDKYFTRESIKALEEKKINVIKESMIRHNGSLRLVEEELKPCMPYLTNSYLQQFKYSGKHFPKGYFNK